MLRRVIWLGVAAALLPLAALAGNPPAIEWVHQFYGQGEADGVWVAQTSDGGYIATGATMPVDSIRPDIYLVKVNPRGTVEWERSFGGPDWDEGKGVVQTSDGGYVVVGLDAGHLGTPTLIKVDSAGEELWQRFLSRDSCEWGHAVLQTPDGGFAVGGYKSGGDTTGLWLVKTDSLGMQFWDRIYQTLYGDQPNVFSIGLTSDGGYILTGEKSGQGLWLIRTDSLGGVMWSETYGDQKLAHGYSVVQTADSGFVVTGAGGSLTDQADPSVICLLKVDAQGNDVWRREFGGDNMDCGYSIRQTADGGYVVAGIVVDAGNSNDAIVVKTNAAGALQWTTRLGTDVWYDNARCVEQTTDRGYVVCGYMTDPSDGRATLYIAKFAPYVQ